MKKAAVEYPTILMLIVIVTLPYLFLQLHSKVTETKTIGDAQLIMLGAPYSKEDIINYLQESAKLTLSETLKACGTPQSMTDKFNQEMNTYINAFNAKSPITKIPTNNYELYIDGKKIYAIAILPVEKKLAKHGTELDSIGTMWFAPSFTVDTTADLSKCVL